jgi:succinate-acetate transporter protein
MVLALSEIALSVLTQVAVTLKWIVAMAVFFGGLMVAYQVVSSEALDGFR